MAANKRLKDLRGPQTRIGRLLTFHVEGYVHVLFFRIIIPLAILYGLCAFAYLAYAALGPLFKIFTLVMWVLWTPQVFEVMRGFALSWTRGVAFGHLNEEFAALYRKRYPKPLAFYYALPFVVLAIWIAGFVVLLLRWYP